MVIIFYLLSSSYFLQHKLQWIFLVTFTVNLINRTLEISKFWTNFGFTNFVSPRFQPYVLLNLLILTILYFICLSVQLIPLSTVWNNIGLDENYVGDQTKDKGKAEPLPSKRWQAILRTQSGIIVQSLIGSLQEKSIRSRLVYVPCYSQGYASYKARNARTRLCRRTEAENSWLLVSCRRRALKRIRAVQTDWKH